MASLSTQYEKPLLWVEVFAGGIGGMIARSRPKQDPLPDEIKAAYIQFANSNPFPDNLQTEDYGFTNQEGDTLTAIDAEVDILAGHATRFAVDTMEGNNTSIYPYSMYLIGLKRAWVFHAPFDTIPINVEHTRNETKEVMQKSEVISDNWNFLSTLLEDAQNESASA